MPAKEHEANNHCLLYDLTIFERNKWECLLSRQ
jgi:hypothetical protein